MVLRSLAELNTDLPVVLISAAPPNRPDDLPPRLDFADHFLKPLDHLKVLQCLGDLLGLDWNEADEKPVPPAPALLETETPAVEMATLRAMIENGRISEIMDWAEALKAKEPQHESFADKIHIAARQLDFPTLKALTGA